MLTEMGTVAQVEQSVMLPFLPPFHSSFTQRGKCTDRRQSAASNAFRGGIDGVPTTFECSDLGHWHPKGHTFLPWAVTDLVDTGLGRRDSTCLSVSTDFLMWRLRFREFVTLIIVRFLWLGVIETERGANYPLFFKVNLAPPLWRFLRRDDGGCASELMNGADCIHTPPSAFLVGVSSDLFTGCRKHVIQAAYNAADH